MLKTTGNVTYFGSAFGGNRKFEMISATWQGLYFCSLCILYGEDVTKNWHTRFLQIFTFCCYFGGYLCAGNVTQITGNVTYPILSSKIYGASCHILISGFIKGVKGSKKILRTGGGG